MNLQSWDPLDNLLTNFKVQRVLIRDLVDLILFLADGVRLKNQAALSFCATMTEELNLFGWSGGRGRRKEGSCHRLRSSERSHMFGCWYKLLTLEFAKESNSQLPPEMGWHRCLPLILRGKS